MKKSFIIFCISLCFFLARCKSNNTHLNSQLVGQEIVLPDLMKYVQGWEYPDENCGVNSDFQMIVWVNGDCPPCVVELGKWQVFFNDFAFHKNIRISFFVHCSVAYDHFVHITRNVIHFGLPVFHDSENDLVFLNNISPENGEDVLLLKNNKVIYIGNPIRDRSANEDIKRVVSSSL